MARPPTRRLWGLVVALAAFTSWTPSARGDYDETERRLKACGADDALRKKVHGAIDRGVALLVSRQTPDGLFADTSEYGSATPHVGVSLLCALALRHAGTPETVASVARAVDRLFAKSPEALREIEGYVYQAGVALMLLSSVPGHEATARRIASALAAGLDPVTGWWGYDTPSRSGDREPPQAMSPFFPDRPNLSTCQFAALGLWAARRKGIAVPEQVWMRHATALCDVQKPNGSWEYWARGSDNRGVPYPSFRARVRGYATGTYMGLANLLLAREALKGSKGVPADLQARIARAIEAARSILAVQAPITLVDPHADRYDADDPDLPPHSSLGERAVRTLVAGFGPHYTLYALEKACLFADARDFPVPPILAGTRELRLGARLLRGQVLWYATGADWLLVRQQPDGGWLPCGGGGMKVTGSSEVDTAFALLFLLRSPSVFHPTTPSEIDAKPRGETTPTEPGMSGMGG